jgi:hypothetical protein
VLSRFLPETAFLLIEGHPNSKKFIQGSGCFFHGKMIAPVLLISNWLLPPG